MMELDEVEEVKLEPEVKDENDHQVDNVIQLSYRRLWPSGKNKLVFVHGKLFLVNIRLGLKSLRVAKRLPGANVIKLFCP